MKIQQQQVAPFPGYRHEPGTHIRVSELAECALNGRWVRDEVRELEFPESGSFVLIWCSIQTTDPAFSLYRRAADGRAASDYSWQRLCPAADRCTGNHSLFQVQRDQLQSVEAYWAQGAVKPAGRLR